MTRNIAPLQRWEVLVEENVRLVKILFNLRAVSSEARKVVA